MDRKSKSLQNLLDENLNAGNIVYLTGDIFITDNISHILSLEKQLQINDVSLFTICKKGLMRITTNNKEHTVSRGGILICTGLHTVSSAMVSTDFECSIVGLSHRKLIELFPTDKEIITNFLHIKDNPVILLNEDETHLLKLYKEILDTKCRGHKFQLDSIILDKLLYAVIYELIQIYSRRHSEQLESSFMQLNGHLYGQEFLSLLAEDKCRHRQVKYFAEKLCITPKYLSIVCQKETGKTPSEWIREHCVAQINYYLLNTTLSVKEICALLDFPNSSFLCKFTKKHLGMSPMEFRQKNKK